MSDTASGARKRGPVPPKMPALLIPADPTQPVQTIDLESADKSLGHLQRAVGGLVDVQAHDVGDLWLNDEGRLIDAPVNVRASYFVLNDSQMAKEGRAGEHSVLYGDVVLTGPVDMEGDVTAVDPAMVTYFKDLELDVGALRDWDVRSVEWTVTDWPDFPEPGGMEL